MGATKEVKKERDSKRGNVGGNRKRGKEVLGI